MVTRQPLFVVINNSMEHSSTSTGHALTEKNAHCALQRKMLCLSSKGARILKQEGKKKLFGGTAYSSDLV